MKEMVNAAKTWGWQMICLVLADIRAAFLPERERKLYWCERRMQSIDSVSMMLRKILPPRLWAAADAEVDILRTKIAFNCERDLELIEARRKFREEVRNSLKK